MNYGILDAPWTGSPHFCRHRCSRHRPLSREPAHVPRESAPCEVLKYFPPLLTTV